MLHPLVAVNTLSSSTYLFVHLIKSSARAHRNCPSDVSLGGVCVVLKLVTPVYPRMQHAARRSTSLMHHPPPLSAVTKVKGTGITTISEVREGTGITDSVRYLLYIRQAVRSRERGPNTIRCACAPAWSIFKTNTVAVSVIERHVC